MDQAKFLSDIAFTDAVKAEQTRRGSRDIYLRRDFQSSIRPHLEAFLAEVDTAYLATATADGQPYAQHRGGPKGFIKIIDDETIGFADYRGNQQYITIGNLNENNKAFLFLMDYANRRRIKLWGRARIVEDPDIIERVMDVSYAASAERALLFTVLAFDVNCPQHIPQKVDMRLIAAVIAQKDDKIRELQDEIAALHAAADPSP